MRNIYTVPNILTGYRFLIVPVILFLLRPGMGDAIALATFFLFLSGALTDLGCITRYATAAGTWQHSCYSDSAALPI